MRSSIVVAVFVIVVATVALAGSPAQLVGSVEAVYHDGVVTFQVSHPDAISSSVKVYDLDSDALIYDSGPRAQTLVTWPAGHDANGSYRYVVTAWNADGQVVVSQAAANKTLTPIAAISFDTVPADTKFLGPNEIIMGNDLQVGEPQHARLTDNLSGGGDFYLYEEDGSTTHFWIQPDASGEGAFMLIDGSAASGSQFVLEGMGTGGEAVYSQAGTSDFIFRSGSTGDASMVLPASAVSSTEIFNEAGVAATYTTASQVLTTTADSVAVRTINAPSSGYVLATAFVDAYLSHTAGNTTQYSCSISDTLNTPYSNGLAYAQISLGAGTGGYRVPISQSRIFQVSAGSNQLHLVCTGYSTGTVTIYDRHLDLLFVPTAHGSVTTESKNFGDDPMDYDQEGAIDMGAGSSPSAPSMTQAEADAEMAESIAFNLARIQAELDTIKAMTDSLAAESTNDQ